MFDSFGRLNSESNAAVDCHFAFTGKFFDDLGDTENTTSLSHHWNRWYDPQLGRWLSEDPIGFAGGDANLGRYVGNHATGAVDVNGLFMDDPAFGQSANDTPGYEELVLPWDPRADWSFGTTLRVWFGKAQLYGGAVGQGGKTSAKAAVNTAIGTVTLGHVPDAFAVTDDDLGYGGSRAGFELAVNILNPLSKMGKAGNLASQALSYGGDLNSVAQGAYGVYEDGLDSGDLQNFANALPAPRRPKNSNGGALGVVDDAADAPKPGARTSVPVEEDGVVYRRTNPKTNEEYVGQAKSPARFDARQGEHDGKLGVQHDYEILGRAPAGTKLDVLEEDMIRANGGIQKEGGALANRRHQMSEGRYRANGGQVDK